MRLLAVLSTAVLAGAIVLPSVPLAPKGRRQSPFGLLDPGSGQDDDAFWGSNAPSEKSFVSGLDEATGRETLKAAFDKLASTLALDGKDDHPRLTIYELIHRSEHTTKFAKLVDDHPSIVELLKSTKANHTLFVPTNEAFDHVPAHDKPSKEFVESILKYHVGIGIYPARRILSTHTLPTALDEKLLGGEPQRLRTSIGFRGVTINFYSKVVVANIEATNGIIHAVDHILVPPPYAGRIITLLPGQFSTLLLAYEKTEFVKYIHGVTLVGSTVFAPSNDAFKRLGIRANAFLFNTEKGVRYLKALLKYHISPNATLYSDAYYDKTGGKDVGASEREHYDLPTLLSRARVSVDISRWAGFSAMVVNGFVGVSVRDGLAKNGVIQMLDKVLIPAHKHRHDGKSADVDEIDVEELMERLDPYLEEHALPGEL
ncbi:fasciclin domain family protein [Drechmeria coniospora]|uniref:Fasciclin domain family protein n=1 Tax=Drechmeria coniospora TaxID=98403 RepID=A0A151GB86_DRECN|nr:fasciclin domain family protein [Drechmeria coniospora]KYK54367.1 fasciclin domain family protein [Drechmeria coniospora]ODA77344.1 hypothetical protein RJ55_06972 [Drechmeria coniospora]